MSFAIGSARIIGVLMRHRLGDADDVVDLTIGRALSLPKPERTLPGREIGRRSVVATVAGADEPRRLEPKRLAELRDRKSVGDEAIGVARHKGAGSVILAGIWNSKRSGSAPRRSPHQLPSSPAL